MVAKSKVVVVNVDVQQAGDEVRIKSEEVGFVVHFRVCYAEAFRLGDGGVEVGYIYCY